MIPAASNSELGSRVVSVECVTMMLPELAVEFGGTWELAVWCKLLRDRGWTGARIAAALGHSEGYVNNLVRVVERASLRVLARWRLEQDPDNALAAACATDWLLEVCLLPRDAQDVELERRIARVERR
jgi:hypothetical protein